MSFETGFQRLLLLVKAAAAAAVGHAAANTSVMTIVAVVGGSHIDVLVADRGAVVGRSDSQNF